MRSLVCVALVVVQAAIAHADRVVDAKRLFEEGRALQAEQKFTEACERFARSYELDRKPGTELNLGDCAERAGQHRRAWLLFDDAARAYDRNRSEAQARLAKDPASKDAKRDVQIAEAGGKLARERAAALAPKLGKLTVRLPADRPEGLAIRISGRAVPPAPEMIELVDAGEVTVSARAPGRQPFEITTTAEAGKETVVDIPVLAVGPGGDPGPRDQPVAGRRARSRVRLAYALGGLGGVALVTSGIVTLSARSQYNDAEARCERVNDKLVCSADDAEQIDSAGKKADIGTYTFVAGAVLVAAGAVVYFTAPREGVTITPAVSPSGAGVTLSGRF